MKVAMLMLAVALMGASQLFAQAPPTCRVLCTPEFKVEPTVTFSNVFGSPRIVDDQGTTTREPRETAFEVILSLGLPTRVSWLEFTVEAIFLPFPERARRSSNSRRTSYGCRRSGRAGGSVLTSTSSTSSVPRSGRVTVARTRTS